MPLTRPCPACASASKPGFVVGGFRHAVCVKCGSAFVDPAPTHEQLIVLYGAQNYYNGARRHEARLRREASDRAERLRQRGVSSVLDVGCAAGYFLDAARHAGMRAVGIEPGPAGEDALRAGHDVRRNWVSDVDLGEERFGSVTMWEVIEHVAQPLELLNFALDHLAPRGVLALSTPSMSGLPALVMGKRFPMITPPEHLTLLTRRGLHRLLARAGLRVELVRGFSNIGREQLEAGLCKYVLGGSRTAQTVAHWVAKPASLGTTLMDRVGLGSEFEIYARRISE